MQIKIELINTFNTNKEVRVKGKTTRELTIEEGEALYSLLEKLLIKLEDKGREYWKEKQTVPTKLYKLALNEIKKESNNNLQNESIDDIFDDDWIIGE